MSSYPMRDPVQDHLITPQNAALLIIDYQPVQVNSINSMPRSQLVANIVNVTELIRSFNIPVVLSTVNVATGINKETIPSLLNVLQGMPSYDRTTINAWEDAAFNEAVKKTGRKKLLMTALWTEACLSFPTLDALKEGYEVYPIVDAVGGTSLIAHETALRRVEQAGAQLTSIAQLACELQRDWNRSDTAKHMVKALTNAGAFLKL
ncbi:hydrolase [Asinibacterium sp. OR53]|uniref:hydrolase n=1 Tax=Asinibacterium sp. OR53 TaxID=925409 RepID=UPI00047D1384|nr:hydrolase [Asinibacterium sp. OR53]